MGLIDFILNHKKSLIDLIERHPIVTTWICLVIISSIGIWRAIKNAVEYPAEYEE